MKKAIKKEEASKDFKAWAKGKRQNSNLFIDPRKNRDLVCRLDSNWPGLKPSYLLHGDCIEIMAQMKESIFSSIVTDPPYLIAQINKTWDKEDSLNLEEWANQVLRVLKPGGHILAFGATRTIHKTAIALEKAGMEIRDLITWNYFSGFPKSLSISEGIDKFFGPYKLIMQERKRKEFEGYGTGLKPSFEPIVMARKPIDQKTIVENVIKHGTGGLNIDGCRFGWDDDCNLGPKGKREKRKTIPRKGFQNIGNTSENVIDKWSPLGRWPANSYQCPKPSTKEREQGCDTLQNYYYDDTRKDGLPGGDNPRNRGTSQRKNYHPTVKPIKLMKWLIRLVTPPNGLVLEPFAGSGTTLAASIIQGFEIVGIEKQDEYLPIIKAKIEWARHQYKIENQQMRLFK